LAESLANEAPPGLATLRTLVGAPASDDGTWITVELRRHGDQGLTVVSQRAPSDDVEHQWTCVWQDSLPEHCAETRFGVLDVIDPGQTLPRAWLLSVDMGGHRSHGFALAWLDASAHVALLDLESRGGDGANCGDLGPGYCLWMEGVCTTFMLRSPECVEVGETVKWSAVHVRMRNRWVQAKRKPLGDEDDAPAVGTYRPTPDGWVRGECARQ
jgi:hypothetical protein